MKSINITSRQRVQVSRLLADQVTQLRELEPDSRVRAEVSLYQDLLSRLWEGEGSTLRLSDAMFERLLGAVILDHSPLWDTLNEKLRAIGV